jgi:hypothetical protein
MGGRFVCVIVVAAVIGCGGGNKRPPGDAPDDSGVVNPDGGSGNGQFGDPCTMHGDCASGYCVEPSPGYGGVCTKTCTDTCPTSYDCLSVTYPGTTVMLCIPNAARLCSSCANDTECPGGACLSLDASNRCASTCNTQADCPTHYTCTADPSGTHTGNFCQPETGSCTCNNTMDGAIRSCSNANAIGTCWGTQTCTAATGWSGCTAATATTESCNGVDDDCNFLIDDGVGGGTSCPITNGFGTCQGVQVCDGTSGFVCHGQMPMMETCNGIDDNCNGTTDEGFAGLGQACTAGVGACLRYGANSCNSTHDGVVCGAVAGTATTETCNQIDDDCDGVVDNGFPTLGTSCNVGMGVCTRYGSYVCKADHSGVQCSATAGTSTGPETCNYLDDDCNGILDDGFRNPATGLYSLSAQNCGACGNDCTTQFTVAHSSGQCSVIGSSAQCTMACTAGYFDLDATTLDGCEFFLDATAIYVAGADTAAVDDGTCGLGPVGTGAGNHPCKTITYGLTRAGTTGRTQVLVANATYNEAVSLVNGKNLLGGYTSTFSRDLANTSTVIEGFSQVAPHQMTVTATNITNPTVFEGFVIRASDVASAHGNSYGIYISGSSANLTIRANEIFGGRGGPGGFGTAGTKGTAGKTGTAYSSAFDSIQAGGSGTCNASNNRAGGAGGVQTCPSSDDVGGGIGGGNNCTALAPTLDTRNSTSTNLGAAGQPGAGAGGGGGGATGVRGYDGYLQGSSCVLPCSNRAGNGACNGVLLPMFGADGAPGADGGSGGGVAGCSATTGTVIAGHWVGNTGLPGNAGFNGGGGGGGGPGGGSQCQTAAGATCPSYLGGKGGGGGTGGCGGTGGGGGIAGGGAFGIFVSGGTAPTITGNTITMGAGGSGGNGGIAGAGGVGGLGIQGGQVGANFCTGKGGRGGDGGIGGAGSGGGGACGGNSYGIYTSGIGTPTYCGSNTTTGGVGGAGGAGGTSGGNPGGVGTAGIVLGCSFN